MDEYLSNITCSSRSTICQKLFCSLYKSAWIHNLYFKYWFTQFGLCKTDSHKASGIFGMLYVGCESYSIKFKLSFFWISEHIFGQSKAFNYEIIFNDSGTCYKSQSKSILIFLLKNYCCNYRRFHLILIHEMSQKHQPVLHSWIEYWL